MNSNLGSKPKTNQTPPTFDAKAAAADDRHFFGSPSLKATFQGANIEKIDEKGHSSSLNHSFSLILKPTQLIVTPDLPLPNHVQTQVFCKPATTKRTALFASKNPSAWCLASAAISTFLGFSLIRLSGIIMIYTYCIG